MTTAASNQGSLRVTGLTAIVDYAVSSHTRAVAVLVLAALLAFLPGFFHIPPTDRDEARFAQATKQMLETGEYVDIRFQDEVRYKKPVGIYWLQAGVVKAATALGMPNAQHTIWVYRIPSLIGAIGAVLLTYWTALSFVSRRAALLAGLMMARNHGSTSKQSQSTPATGRRPASQRTERSVTARARIVSTTNMTMSGPLIRMPAASAVQKIAGKAQPVGPAAGRRSPR